MEGGGEVRTGGTTVMGVQSCLTSWVAAVLKIRAVDAQVAQSFQRKNAAPHEKQDGVGAQGSTGVEKGTTLARATCSTPLGDLFVRPGESRAAGG
jgi:uncharacterized membrane protein